MTGGRGAAVAAAALLVACGRVDATGPGPSVPPRSFAMGFTPSPGAFSVEAVDFAWSVVGRDGDLVLLHFDDGVPWEEALAGAPYTHDAELRDQARRLPPGHAVYVAATPLSFLRDGLAPRRGVAGREPLRAPWAGRALDDPDVVTAFGNYCLNLIARFSPRYFAYAIEANMLAEFSPSQWPAFLRLAPQVYARVKAAHPTLPVFVTLQVEFVQIGRASCRERVYVLV